MKHTLRTLDTLRLSRQIDVSQSKDFELVVLHPRQLKQISGGEWERVSDARLDHVRLAAPTPRAIFAEKTESSLSTTSLHRHGAHAVPSFPFAFRQFTEPPFFSIPPPPV